MNCLTLIFYGVLYYYGNLSNSLPIYIYIFIAFWVITNITLFIQERSKTTKTSHSNILKYLLLNIICGFSITLAFSTIYVFGAIANGYEVFNY